MFNIRRAQLESLGRSKRNKLLAAFAARLRDDEPSSCATLSDAQLETKASTAVQQARAFGCMTAPDLYTFCRLYLRLGDDFCAEPWAEQIISSRYIDGAARVRQLAEHRLSAPLGWPQ